MALALGAGIMAGPAVADGPIPPAPGSTTTSTLPAIPTVPPDITDGRDPQQLLSDALTLSSVGLDYSALSTAIAATSQKLDADATRAKQADASAAAADRAATTARGEAGAADARLQSLRGAMRQAVVYLYATGGQSGTVNPQSGDLALYARDYVLSADGPFGVIETSRRLDQSRRQALSSALADQRRARADQAVADQALRDQQQQIAQLNAQLQSLSASTAAQVAADHISLAGQAGQELTSANTSLQFDPKTPLPAPVSTTAVALTWAFSELGKPYVWGATGPGAFDCSGLTQYVWHAAGVDIPRVAADQDAWTVPVPLSQLLPGDLVFFGTTDIHHVGIYIGDGLMINAPHTGDVVRVSSMWWSDLAGFGRVHAPGTPVPPHGMPSPVQPAPTAIVPTARPVPSQAAPSPGSPPTPGSGSPVSDGRSTPPPTAPATTSTTAMPGPPEATTTLPGGTGTTTTVPSTTTTTAGP